MRIKVGTSMSNDGQVLEFQPSTGVAATVSETATGEVIVALTTSGAFSATGNLTITSDSDVSGGGDIIFYRGVTENGRFKSTGFEVSNGGAPSIRLGYSANMRLIGTSTSGVSVTEPLINWVNIPDGGSEVIQWQTGLDASNSANGDLVLAAYAASGPVQDVVYLTAYSNIVACGFGYTPPPSGYRVSISAQDNSSWGALRLRMGSSATGAYLNAVDSGGRVAFQINNGGSIQGHDATIDANGLQVVSPDTGSIVLGVVGANGQTGDVLRATVTPAANGFHCQNDGGNIKALVKSSGKATVTLRSQTQIALLEANTNTDGILLLRILAGQTGVPLTVRDATPTTYFEIGVDGSVSTRGNVVVLGTTGMKIGTATSQKLSLWNTAPDVQPTTAITAAAFVANTSGIADDTATWGGYTGGQVVAALKRLGALA